MAALPEDAAQQLRKRVSYSVPRYSSCTGTQRRISIRPWGAAARAGRRGTRETRLPGRDGRTNRHSSYRSVPLPAASLINDHGRTSRERPKDSKGGAAKICSSCLLCRRTIPPKGNSNADSQRPGLSSGKTTAHYLRRACQRGPSETYGQHRQETGSHVKERERTTIQMGYPQLLPIVENLSVPGLLANALPGET